MEALPVPQQLNVQLAKCKKVRDADYHKSRQKTKQEIAAALEKLPPIVVKKL